MMKESERKKKTEIVRERGEIERQTDKQREKGRKY